MRCFPTRAASRLRGLVLALVVASLVSLPGVATQAHATGDGPRPAPPVSERTSPAVGEDFARLPPRCYDALDNPVRRCYVTTYPRNRPMVVLWGDSHAWMYLPALRKAAKVHRVNLVVMVAGGCPPAIPNARVPGKLYTQCEGHDVYTLNFIRSLTARGKKFKLILGAFWSGYREEYQLIKSEAHPERHFSAYAQQLINLAHYGTKPLFEELGELGVDTDVIGQAATVPNHPHPCAAGLVPYTCNLPRDRALKHEPANRAWLKKMMAPLTGTPRYIDATSAYCSTATCFGTVDGIHTFYDSLHLGAGLTATLRRFFQPSFDDLL